MVYKQNKKDSDYLSAIQTAITNLKVISLKYHSFYNGKTTHRNVEPLAVYFTNDNWIMIAWIQLRRDLREFRLDRIKQLNESGFVFPKREFDYAQYTNQHSS